MSDRFDKLFEELGSLKATMTAFRDENRNLAERADTERNELKEQIIKVSDKVTSIDTRTSALEADMSAAKPFIEKAQKWEQRGIGAGMVLTAMGAIFGGVAVGMRDKIFSYLGWA